MLQFMLTRVPNLTVARPKVESCESKAAGVAACTCTAACVPGKTGHVIHESVDDSFDDMFFKDILLQVRLLPASLSGFWWI